MTAFDPGTSDILVEDIGDGVRRIELNRPDRHNATSRAMRLGLNAAIEDAERGKDVRVLLITGAGEKSYSVGADLKDSGTHSSEDVGDSMGMFIPSPNQDAIPRTRLPIISAVHGYCCGAGFEMALASDIVLCSETAQFWFPQTDLGIFPGAGGTLRLVKAVGKTRAMEIVLSGRRVPGSEAAAIGIASHVYADRQQLMDAAVDLARSIGSKSPLGVAFAKQSILRGMDLTVSDALIEDNLRLFPLYGTRDRKEASAAFLERRKPVFEGR